MVRATNGHHHNDINTVLQGIRARSSPPTNIENTSHSGPVNHVPVEDRGPNCGENATAVQPAGQAPRPSFVQSVNEAGGQQVRQPESHPQTEPVRPAADGPAQPREQVYRGTRFVPGANAAPDQPPIAEQPANDTLPDDDDTDLPTMFTRRAAPPTAGPRRLTEALRGATIGRTIPAATKSNSALPRATDADSSTCDGRIEPTLQLSSIDRDQHFSAPVAASRQPTERQTDGQDAGAPVGRKMASFLDTRMNRMAQSAQVEEEIPIEEAIPDDVTELQSPEEATGQEDASALAGDIHDVAAELLRPMLKDWVGENMPQIVEKALSQERSGAGKKGDKS